MEAKTTYTHHTNFYGEAIDSDAVAVARVDIDGVDEDVVVSVVVAAVAGADAGVMFEVVPAVRVVASVGNGR